MRIRRFLSVLFLLSLLGSVPVFAAPRDRGGDPETPIGRVWKRVIQKFVRIVTNDQLIIPIP